MKTKMPEIAEELRRERAARMQFTRALQAGDPAAFIESLTKLDWVYDGLRWALRKVAKLDEVDPKIKEACLQFWINSGDHLRQEVDDDLMIVRALRMLLPRYAGSAWTLYRGESALNWKRRTYGLAWSSRQDVADSFAKTGVYRTSAGGSVVLEVQASPDAIICALLHHDDRYGEDEYLIDRRKVTAVKVLRRYPQLSFDEYLTLTRH
jgi:hypothetical protein